MTTLTLTIDKDTKRFELDDGPKHVHAGETVELVLKGLGITAETANGTNIPQGETEDPPGYDLTAVYPYLRARLLHPAFGDVAMYPWPGSSAQWEELDDDHPGAGLKCQIDLDTEQLFRVVRSGHGDELSLFVETPWPESVPTVYGTYGLRVEDWPEATGEIRVFPAAGRYANAFAPLLSIDALPAGATLNQTITLCNAMLAALKQLAKRNGGEEQ